MEYDKFAYGEKAEYFGNCVNNPFDSPEALDEVIDDADEITKKEFLEGCEVTDDLITDMEEFENDYAFYKFEDIYFFTHSAIEYFYR